MLISFATFHADADIFIFTLLLDIIYHACCRLPIFATQRLYFVIFAAFRHYRQMQLLIKGS